MMWLNNIQLEGISQAASFPSELILGKSNWPWVFTAQVPAPLTAVWIESVNRFRISNTFVL